MIWPCNPPFAPDLLHPDEKRAVLEIQESGLYHYAAQLCGDIITKTAALPQMLLTGFPVTALSAPRLYRCYQKALKRLRCREEYPLFLDFGYELTARILGSDENGYNIVMNSSCGDKLDDDELTAFLGGEIGHILAGHAHNRALLDHLDILTQRIPAADEIIKNKVLGAFAGWMIASEYSVDRAALFASESLEAVVSLRKQQMGMKEAATRSILEQQQTAVPEHPGMYYVLMAKDLPVLGAVGRIQELYRWVNTAEFRTRFPCLYYKICMESSGDVSPYDCRVYQLHLEAMHGNPDALAELGEAYLLGKDGLEQIAHSGEGFLREAAMRGNARAQYLLGLCRETGVPDDEKKPEDAEILYRAAASRGNQQAAAKISGLPSRKMPEAVVNACRCTAANVSGLCWNAFSGELPDKSSLREAMDWFWVPVNETLIAAELHKTLQGYTGLLLASGGIYGSCTPGGQPIFISWEAYDAASLTQRGGEEARYLWCGEQEFYLCQNMIKGTMAELLIRIKADMENT